MRWPTLSPKTAHVSQVSKPFFAAVLHGLQALLLITGYPLLIYALLSWQLAWLGTLLVFALIAWRLRHRPHWPWLLTLLVVGLLISARLFGLDAVLKLSPQIIHSGLLALFLHSLSGTPLIEQFARLEFAGQLPPGIAADCRKLTKLWIGFFAANIIGCSWLALYGDDASWVLYNGLIVYLLIAALLLGEFFWRRIAFPDIEIPPLAQTIRSIIDNGDQIWGAKPTPPPTRVKPLPAASPDGL